MSRALILLGDGFSSSMLAHFQREHPQHEIWSLNATLAEGSALHFEIHYDQIPELMVARAMARNRDVPLIVSPFREYDPEHEELFPLPEIFARWGVALFERTLDYMLALALLWRAEGLLRCDTICLPGHDFCAAPHHHARTGAHFWLGLAAGQGIRLETTPRSALLKRRPDLWSRAHAAEPPDVRADQPHMYGQPRCVTQSLAAKYRWNEAA